MRYGGIVQGNFSTEGGYVPGILQLLQYICLLLQVVLKCFHVGLELTVTPDNGFQRGSHLGIVTLTLLQSPSERFNLDTQAKVQALNMDQV